MPIVAVAIAGGSLFAGGAAAIGAVFAGTATLATTLTAVATIGAVVGAVGAVTGDKTLSTIGLVMGAVGGVGSLAANAGVFGEAATTEPLFGSGTQSLADSGIPADEGSAQIGAGNSGASVPDSLSAFNPMAGVSGSSADTLAGTGLIGTGMGGAQGSTGTLGTAPSGAAVTPGLNPEPASAAAAAHAGDIVEGPVGGEVSPSAPVSTAPAAPTAPVAAAPTADTPAADKGVLSGIRDFLTSKDHQLVTYGLIQAAGSFISGAFDTLKPAQVAALQAQANMNNATAGVTNTQLANMQQPLPAARRGGGLINTVTGATA